MLSALRFEASGKVEFTVQYAGHETHIHKRLEREKRCGTVMKLGEHSSKFVADIYDASELIPWVRTFICRITHFECSDKILEQQFNLDLHRMYALYGLEGGEDN
jgi:hypothetical protein